MGSSDTRQKPFFYAFNLDDAVPQDHLLRSIDRFLDLSDLRHHLGPYYSHTGRPSVDPELMIRTLLIGYCLGIRSERRLYREWPERSPRIETRATKPLTSQTSFQQNRPKPVIDNE